LNCRNGLVELRRQQTCSNPSIAEAGSFIDYSVAWLVKENL
jgi:hypothetical protein